jgi:D-amino-acid oxidase
VEGTTGTEPDPAVEAAVPARACALVPELRGTPVLSRAVGLRPGRPTVRLERLDVDGRPVVACYGHGGAGATLSWAAPPRSPAWSGGRTPSSPPLAGSGRCPGRGLTAVC